MSSAATNYNTATGTKKWADLFEKPTTDESTIIGVIEIHHETTQEKPAEKDQKSNEKSDVKKDVHPEMKKIAEHTYIKYLDTITKISSRSKLEDFYFENVSDEIRQKLQDLGLGFSQFLFALARGLKVVNVFRPEGQSEQTLGWHKPEAKYRDAHRDFHKKKLRQDDEGWTSNGKPSTPKIAAKPDQTSIGKSVIKQEQAHPPKSVSFEPTAKAVSESTANHADVSHDYDATICQLKTIKSDIQNHQDAMNVLIPFHQSLESEISMAQQQPCDVAKRVADFYMKAKHELEQFLDTLSSELTQMNETKVILCEQLKN